MNRLMLLGLGALAIVAVGACYDPEGLQEHREEAQLEVFEDRFDSSGEPGGEPTSTPTDPAATPDPNDPSSAVIQNMPVGDYYQTICAACHGGGRGGGVGPALTPDALTEADDFYIDTIINGREGTVMSAYGGGAELTDDEVAWMVTFLKNVEP